MGGVAGGSDHLKFSLVEGLGNARNERGFRTNHRQLGIKRLGQACEPGGIVEVGWVARRYLGDSSVALRTIEFRGVRTLTKFPADRVFSASGADYEDFHIRGILSSIHARRKKNVSRFSFLVLCLVCTTTLGSERSR